MIKAEHLTKKFDEFTAVDDISFEINQGEIVGLLGPNGAGKTTTLRILTNFFNPTFGSVKFDDLDIIEDNLKIRQKLGYLPENNPLYEEMKVSEYLKYAAEMQEIPKDKIKQAITQVIETCGLKEKNDKEISTLSKGYKQRVGLAQALIHDPEILILDEPTEGLDPNQRIEIRDLIKRIGQQKTIILSSHVLSEVEATCKRVLIINKGKIAASGTPAELKNQAAGQTLIYLTVKGPKQEIEQTLNNTEGVLKIIKSAQDNDFIKLEIEADSTKELRNKIVKIIAEKGWDLFEIYKHDKSLEDIFVKLTTEPTNRNQQPTTETAQPTTF